MSHDKGRAGERLPPVLSTPVSRVTLVLLGLFAIVETSVDAVVADAGMRLTFGLCVVAVCTTLPMLVLGTSGAAVVVIGASILSLVAFDTFTVAGLIALLIASYRLGCSGLFRSREPLLLAASIVPFGFLALIGPHPLSSEVSVLTMLLAILFPVALSTGIVALARNQMHQNELVNETFTDTLVEHTARGERARIARELHDVVAHHISIIAVQAETTRLTTPNMPAAGEQRLSSIADTARTALTEMRRLLGVLREDTKIEATSTRPQPGLWCLNELLDETREASGTGVRLVLGGSPVALDPGVDLAVYRIAQEALTNARRHAPGAAVDVELYYGDDMLRLRVRDNGPGPSIDGLPTGHGLVGMRERATAVGGRLQIDSAAGGGFVVEAVLPVTNSLRDDPMAIEAKR